MGRCMPPAEPASVPTVSAPADDVFREHIFDASASGRANRALVVGVEEGLSDAVRLYQSVRSSTQLPASMAAVLVLPCSNAVGGEHVVRVFRASFERSMTQTGATKFLTGIRVGRAVLYSLPGSMHRARRNACRLLAEFGQFHAEYGPFWSYCEIAWTSTRGVFLPISGGR